VAVFLDRPSGSTVRRFHNHGDGCSAQNGRPLQIPAHRGQSFRRIADSIPVIADSF